MRKFILWSRDHPLPVVFIISGLTIFFVSNAINIRVDPSTEGMLIPDDPDMPLYQQAVDIFGSDNIAIIYIKDEKLFSYDKLIAIEEVFYNLEEVPGVSRVDGLYNATNFKGNGDLLTANPLFDWIPDDPSELASIKDDALRNPLLNGTLIAPEGKAMVILATMEASGGDSTFIIEASKAIDKIIEPLKGNVDQVFQVGVPEIRKFMRKSIVKDQTVYAPLFPIVLIILLIVGIRTVNGAVLPMMTGGLSIIWTLGFMVMMNIPYNFLTGIFPALVMVIGATEDMHMLSEYLYGIEMGKTKLKAIDYMATKTGTAILLTGLTTFLGFISIVVNDISILKQFGFSIGFALFVNPIITASLVPVYLRFFGEKTSKRRHSGSKDSLISFKKMSDYVLYLVNHRSRWILGVLIGSILLLGVGILSIRVNSNLLGNFKKSSAIRVHSDQLHEELSGAQSFSIVFDGKKEAYFKKAENLKKLALVQEYIAQTGDFDISISAADHIALINREITGGEQVSYVIPDQDDLVAQYFLFFTRADLERYVSADYRYASIQVRHNIDTSSELKQVLDELKTFIPNSIEGSSDFFITGEPLLYEKAAETITRGVSRSLSLILIVIFLITSILFARIKAGFLAMVPNLIPILFLFGILGHFGITLNIGTAIVAACAIGLAVDDTIHLFVRYHSNMKKINNRIDAVRSMIRGEIRPVVITSVGLAIGFTFLGLSSFVPTIQFGLLGALVIIVAFFTDLLVTPILLARTKLISIWDLLGLSLSQNMIKRSRLFRDMARWQIKRVVLLGHLKEVRSGDYIIRQGEVERTMYMIIKGAAKVEIMSQEHDALKVIELHEGDVFGEIALVNEMARTANVIATGDSTVLSLDWEDLNRIGKIFPRISTKLFLNISRILGMRLAATDKRLVEMSD